MREIITTSMFDTRFCGIVDYYAERGAEKLLERLQNGFESFIDSVQELEEVGKPHVLRISGKVLHARKFVLDAKTKAFTILYWIPPEESEAIVLLNIKGGGQNRFKWK